jgi:magnesium transporter
MPTKASMPLALQPDPDLEKKKAASRSWLLLDTNGDSMMLEVDKYAVMHRVGIHARDLRILDPMLSYPSTILGRERAIVLNLEHIKAIITAEEVLLRNPNDDNVIPVVEELGRRLPPTYGRKHNNASALADFDNSLEMTGKTATSAWDPQNETQDGNAEVPPFEFRALEVALEAICSYLDARTTELESSAYPALDELTKKITSRNLDRVRKLKSRMTRLTARVQKSLVGMMAGKG